MTNIYFYWQICLILQVQNFLNSSSKCNLMAIIQSWMNLNKLKLKLKLKREFSIKGLCFFPNYQEQPEVFLSMY